MPAAIPIAAAVGGALISSQGAKSAAKTQAQAMKDAAAGNPQINSLLFGDNNNGLLSQYMSFLNQPQGAGTSAFGDAAQSLLGGSGADMLQQQLQAGGKLANSAITAPQAANATSAAPAQQVTPYGMGNVTYNRGETFSAPQGITAAQLGAPMNVQAAQVGAPQQVTGSTLAAPAQNGINLSGSFSNFINGAGAASNPLLSSSLQAGIDLSNAGYNKNVNTLTDTLQRQVLPGVRSNAILAGQYGGSRQGIAEGLALSDYTRQLNDANSVLGAQNSANVTGQLANSYNQAQDRALAATQALSAQQYGAASQNSSQAQQAMLANQVAAMNAGSQNAQLQQQAALANQGVGLQADTTNAQLQQQAALNNYAGQQAANSQSSSQLQQANLANQNVANQGAQFNAQQQQNAALANQAANQQNNQFNAGLQQQTALANLQALLGTNSLNSANQATGTGLLSGLLSNLNGYATNADNAAINRATQVNGLLAPYLSQNGGTTAQPSYSNTGANLLGGAATGLGLYNQFQGLTGATNSYASGATPAPAGQFFDGYGLVSNNTTYS